MKKLNKDKLEVVKVSCKMTKINRNLIKIDLKV